MELLSLSAIFSV